MVLGDNTQLVLLQCLREDQETEAIQHAGCTLLYILARQGLLDENILVQSTNLVVLAITNFPSNESLLGRCCAYLCMVLDNPGIYTVLCQQTVWVPILKGLAQLLPSNGSQSRKHGPTIKKTSLHNTLMALYALASTPEAVQSIIGEKNSNKKTKSMKKDKKKGSNDSHNDGSDGLQTIVSVLSAVADHRPTICDGVALLHRLVKLCSNRNRFVESGAVQLLVQSMANVKSRKELEMHRIGCAILARIALRHRLGDAALEAVDVILYTLRMLPNDTAVMICGMTGLFGISRLEPGNPHVAQTTPVAVVEILSSSNKNEAVDCLCMCFLHTLSRSPACWESFGMSGALIRTMQMMEKHRDSPFFLATACVIVRNASECPGHWKVIQKRAVETLGIIVEQEKEHPAVIAAAFSTITPLLRGSAVAPVFKTETFLLSVVKAMAAHPGRATVQFQGLILLDKLSTSAENQPLLQTYGIIPAVSTAMRHHHKRLPGVAETTMTVWERFARSNSSIQRFLGESDCLMLCMSAMEVYPTNATIQKGGFELIRLINTGWNRSGLSEMLVERFAATVRQEDASHEVISTAVFALQRVVKAASIRQLMNQRHVLPELQSMMTRIQDNKPLHQHCVNLVALIEGDGSEAVQSIAVLNEFGGARNPDRRTLRSRLSSRRLFGRVEKT